MSMQAVETSNYYSSWQDQREMEGTPIYPALYVPEGVLDNSNRTFFRWSIADTSLCGVLLLVHLYLLIGLTSLRRRLALEYGGSQCCSSTSNVYDAESGIEDDYKHLKKNSEKIELNSEYEAHQVGCCTRSIRCCTCCPGGGCISSSGGRVCTLAFVFLCLWGIAGGISFFVAWEAMD
jgi:hypothetical protein